MDRALLETFIVEGLTLNEMGERAGKDLTTVAYWLKKHGLKATYHDRFAPKGAISRAALQSLLEDDLSMPELARHLKVSV